MKEKLVIRNFGPIKSVELELSRLNVFIGEQGTGKSTVAKLLIAIKNTFFREIINVLYSKSKNKDTQLFFEHLKLVGIRDYLNPDTEILYSSSYLNFSYYNKNVESKEYKPNAIDLFTYDFTYIPSERNLVNSLADSWPSLMAADATLPQLFLRFGDKFNKACKEIGHFDYHQTLGVNFIHKDSVNLIKLNSGRVVPISDTSSGFQSFIPLLTVFDYVANGIKKDNLLVIEEPELNCFPSTQYELVKHIINGNHKEGFNNEYNQQLLITTHSPYVLTSLNNLIYAYQTGQTHKEKVNNVIEEEYWLNPDEVNVYRLFSDGIDGCTCENIMAEDGLIKADMIDEISRTINESFDALLDIELSTENETI